METELGPVRVRIRAFCSAMALYPWNDGPEALGSEVASEEGPEAWCGGTSQRVWLLWALGVEDSL